MGLRGVVIGVLDTVGPGYGAVGVVGVAAITVSILIIEAWERFEQALALFNISLASMPIEVRVGRLPVRMKGA
jgi:hypothetical protein